MGANHPIPCCELCGGEATLYCPSDSAFLCPSCDSHVHHANFLVSRHPRQPLCPNCHSLSSPSLLSLEHPPSLCATCSLPSAEAEHTPSTSTTSSSSSSACISTTHSSVAVTRSRKSVSSCPDEVTSGRRGTGRARCRNLNTEAKMQDAKAEAVFVIWCKRMGLEDYAARIVPGASRVLAACRGRFKALPLRVAVAASFWSGMRMWRAEGWCTWQRLKRVEEVSGVPAKLILAAEAKLTGAVREARRQHVGRVDLIEGWAECGPTN